MGNVAGQAAAITLFSGLGTYLLKQRKSSPFLNIKQCFRYNSIAEAKLNIEKCVLRSEKMVIALTGNGQTSKGVQDVLKAMKVPQI